MATLYITEYQSLDQHGLPIDPPLAEQTVAIGGTSTQSSAFNANTRYLRLHTDAICSVLVGSNPTATAAKKRMADESTEWVQVAGGHKIAVITNS